jgi:hypothetical protein
MEKETDNKMNFLDITIQKKQIPFLSTYIGHGLSSSSTQGLDPLIRSVSRVTTVLTNVSSVFQLFSFLVVCSDMISKGFGLVAFFASVDASSVYISLSCLLCIQSVFHGVRSRLKPTITDAIIPNDSCHPQEHKLAVLKYLVNRMNTHKFNTINKEAEYSKIKQILFNNKYDISIINSFNKTKSKEKRSGTKWAKFTYVEWCYPSYNL